jgi:hypothetical protein
MSQRPTIVTIGVRRVALLIVAALVLSGTSQGAASAQSPGGVVHVARSGTSDPSLGKPGCRPPTRLRAAPNSLPEVHGTSSRGQLWGLVMPQVPLPIRVGEAVKIVWRMTGRGSIRLTSRSPGRQLVPLVFGPDPHATSTYIRPGDEWGAGYRFSHPGCWQLHAQRSNAAGDVWLSVS